jgi:hypothetical protein
MGYLTFSCLLSALKTSPQTTALPGMFPTEPAFREVDTECHAPYSKTGIARRLIRRGVELYAWISTREKCARESFGV